MSGLPLNIDFQQIALHLFNFVILAGGLYILLYKPVKDFMQKRVDHYKHMDESADHVKAELERLKGEYEAKMHEADVEIAHMRSEAATKASEASERKLEETQEKCQKLMAETREAAERERDKIISSAQPMVAKLAAQAAAKIIDENTDVYESFAKAAQNQAESASGR